MNNDSVSVQSEQKKEVSSVWLTWMQRAIPLLIAVAVFVLCITCGGLRYHTNDDANIQDYLSGEYTGTSFPSHPFIHVFLSYPISWLYRLIDGVEWWYVCEQGLMLIGTVLMNCALFSLAKRKGYPLVPVILLTVLANCCLLAYVFCLTSFTVVPAVIGTGAVCLFLAGYETNYRKAACIICYLLFVLAYCYRSDTGNVMICYCLLAVLYVCLTHPWKWYRRAGAFLLAAVLLIGTGMGLTRVNRQYQQRINGKGFTSFNSARASYIDFPHDSYEENPELYEQAGWSQETVWLVEQWCFMDEHVTTENLNFLAKNSKQERKSIRFSVLRERFAALQEQEAIQPTEWFWVAAAAFALAAILFRWSLNRFLVFLANLLGTVILILYQLYLGRILYRTMLICILPSAMINLIIGVTGLGALKKRWLCLALSGLIIVAGIFPAVGVAQVTFSEARAATIAEQESMAIALGEYAKGHPRSIYIRDMATVRDWYPAARRPVNLIDWGKPDFNSAANRLRLKANGIDKLTGEVLKRDNVYFIFNVNLVKREGRQIPEASRLRHFYAWLRQEYGAVGIRQTGRIWEAGLFIYHFVFKENAAEGTYYDILDDGTVILCGS